MAVATSTILAGAAIAAIGAGAYAVGKSGKSKGPDVQPLPQAPDEDTTSQKARAEVKDRMRGARRNKGIYTSPLGLQKEAEIARSGLKTKLGA